MPVEVDGHTIYDDPDQLLKSLRGCIVNRPRTVEYKHLANSSGIPQKWIELFAHDKVKIPDFCRIMKLHQIMIGGTFEFSRKF